MDNVQDQVLVALRAFAASLTANFQLQELNPAQAEDQLESPTQELLREIGKAFDLRVEARTEARTELGVRPDLGVSVGGLLAGHVELEAPGKGVRPPAFTDPHDRDQFKKLADHPNLLYTDATNGPSTATESPWAASAPTEMCAQTGLRRTGRWRPLRSRVFSGTSSSGSRSFLRHPARSRGDSGRDRRRGAQQGGGLGGAGSRTLRAHRRPTRGEARGSARHRLVRGRRLAGALLRVDAAVPPRERG